MTKKDITNLSYQVTGCAIKVHKELGPGLLEGIYQRCLKYELEKNGFSVMQEVIVPVVYDGLSMEMD
jgi:GxxExxY protein